jgi:hypothetical protein
VDLAAFVAMSTSIGTHRARLAVLAFAALLLGACGASGGDDASAGSGGSTTTTTAPADGSTTTAPDGEDPDEGDDPGGSEVDVDALEAALPEAADIAPGFSVVEDDEEEDDGEDSAADKAMEEACPDAAEYFAEIEDDQDDDELKRTYEHTDSRQVEISIDPNGRDDMETADIDKVVGLFQACDEIEYEEDGATTRMTIDAEVDEEHVTKGLLLNIHVVVEAPMLPAPIDVNLKGLLFLVDQVGVSVMMIDGLDEDTMKPVPSDWDRLYELATEMEDRVGEVVGG